MRRHDQTVSDPSFAVTPAPDQPMLEIARLARQAFPDGVPQERALGSIALLNRYGPALVQRLMQELPLDLGHHWVLTL